MEHCCALAAKNGVPIPIAELVNQFVNVQATALESYNILLDCAKWYKRNHSSTNVTKGQSKACFYNVSQLLKESSTSNGAYGFAISRSLPFPIFHAWGVGSNQEVIEVTPGWGKDTWYYGILIPTEWITKLINKQTPAQYDILHAFQWLSQQEKKEFLQDVRNLNKNEI